VRLKGITDRKGIR